MIPKGIGSNRPTEGGDPELRLGGAVVQEDTRDPKSNRRISGNGAFLA